MSLRGRTIVVTRPQAQALALIDGLGQAGATVLRYPLLEIEGVPADQVCLACAGLDAAHGALFVSRNAVAHGAAPILAQAQWPAGVPIFAVGKGTGTALQSLGLSDIRLPADGNDSEALLNLPALQRVAGQRFFLFKGEGGRELLAETLHARGALVQEVVCYYRRAPTADPALLLEPVRHRAVDALIVTSSEAARRLTDIFASWPAGLAQLLVVAPHPRIAAALRMAGCRRIVECAMSDDAMIAALATYNWPSPSIVSS